MGDLQNMILLPTWSLLQQKVTQNVSFEKLTFPALEQMIQSIGSGILHCQKAFPLNSSPRHLALDNLSFRSWAISINYDLFGRSGSWISSSAILLIQLRSGNFFNELALDSQSMAWRIIRLPTTQKVYWVGTMKTHVSVKIIFRKWWPITNKWRTMTKISQLLVLDRILYRRRGQRWGWQGAQGRRWWESEQCSIFLRSLPHSLPPSKHLLLLLRQPAQKSKLTRVQGYLLKPGYQVTATFF